MSTRSSITKQARAVALAAAVFASASCGDIVRSGNSPMYLIVERMDAARGTSTTTFVTPLLSDVQTIVESQVGAQTVRTPSVFNDLGRATIRAELKNTVNPTTPTSVNSITIERYHVDFRRADGRNTPGVDVPYGFDGGITVTISTSTGASEIIFDLVRHQNKREPPLSNLVAGGGARFITVIAEVTFYGRDQANNEVVVKGNIDVQFADFGDES